MDHIIGLKYMVDNVIMENANGWTPQVDNFCKIYGYFSVHFGPTFLNKTE